MVNKKKIQELIAWYNDFEKVGYVDYPWFQRDLWDPLLEALGDDESEIIEFIENADEETQSHMSSIMEGLYEKFPSDVMESFMKIMWPECYSTSSAQ